MFIDQCAKDLFMPVIEFECPHSDCLGEARFNLMNIQVLKQDVKTITCGVCKRSIKFEYSISPVSRTRKYRDADWLRKEYEENNKTMIEIATMCNTSAMTIHHWIKRHGIEARGGGTRKSL
jgi:hypothetical protein